MHPQTPVYSWAIYTDKNSICDAGPGGVLCTTVKTNLQQTCNVARQSNVIQLQPTEETSNSFILHAKGIQIGLLLPINTEDTDLKSSASDNGCFSFTEAQIIERMHTNTLSCAGFFNVATILPVEAESLPHMQQSQVQIPGRIEIFNFLLELELGRAVGQNLNH